MKKGILLAALLLTAIANGYAQERTGFSNPDSIEPLLDYQLPDWGFSNFFLDFSLNRNLSNSLRTTAGDDIERENRNFNVFFNPNYNLFRESEKRIISLNNNVFIGYRNGRDEDSEDNSTREDRMFNSAVAIDVSLREYVSSQVFLLIAEDVRFEYNDTSFEERIDGSLTEERDNFEREFTSVTRLGVGVGRVRNVNPVIRAIRLKERYGVLANGKALGSEQIKATADVFTKFDGFQRRYDRPEKYFWQAVDQAVNASISNLEPFDLFYVTDVLDENIGTRLQGWEISGGGLFRYINDLNQSDEPLTPLNTDVNRKLDIFKTAGAFIQGRWFENLSLKHQLGFTARADRTYPLGSDSITQSDTHFDVQFSWLWNVADRFLLNTRLLNNYRSTKLDENSFFGERRQWFNFSSARSDLTYFIENRFALSAGLNYSLRFRSNDRSDAAFDQRNSVFRFNAGFRYYFGRNLY